MNCIQFVNTHIYHMANNMIKGLSIFGCHPPAHLTLKIQKMDIEYFNTMFRQKFVLEKWLHLGSRTALHQIKFCMYIKVILFQNGRF